MILKSFKQTALLGDAITAGQRAQTQRAQAEMILKETALLRDVVEQMTETDKLIVEPAVILKANKPTAVEKSGCSRRGLTTLRALVSAKHRSYDASLERSKAACKWSCIQCSGALARCFNKRHRTTVETACSM